MEQSRDFLTSKERGVGPGRGEGGGSEYVFKKR